jgi:predicted adenylyl cyclase CyaB
MKLLELKCKVGSLDEAKKNVNDLKAGYIGVFHQIDTYFNVQKGRLKLREVENKKKSELIYYEREDILEPKESDVLIVEIQNTESFKNLMTKVLGKKVVIDKTREIYRYKETQIHLDTVKDLGSFVEFERRLNDLQKDQEALEELIKHFNFKKKGLVRESYSDLALK